MPPVRPAVGPVVRQEAAGAGGRLDALDGVRAVASFTVLVYHVANETGAALREGFTGALLSRGDVAVPIFFALSGLLLYRPFAAAALGGRPAPRTRAYLWRRAVRILPAYWLVVAAALLLWSRDHLTDAWSWFKLLTLNQNYSAEPWWHGLGPKGLAQMWSLSVEAAFYVALPLIAAGAAAFARRGSADADRRARRLLACLGALAATSFVWTLLTHYPQYRPQLSIWPPRSAVYFTAGMALAVALAWAQARPDGPAGRFSRGVAASPGSWWLVAALAYAVAASPVTGDRFLGVEGVWSGLSELVLYTVVAFCLLAPAALLPPGDSPVRRLLGNPVMRFLGRISYGVFLWQFVAIYAWYGFTGQQPFTGDLLANLVPVTALTVGLATLTYLLVERPSQRLNALVRR
ncbi:acyltransferase family protein [Planomonospora parontospora]|uniref:acyltransferase family protein n=1 Tax=Planomonospora parontospora TaxID=58119 RepID=UPI00166FA8B3|nr:acyltransferase [Planomonospora parontospora]GGL08372.1 acyltransferase [Planomonospora parontospora subsp. antibiotica]GII14543.1 acyltransferase [Planomonospora parontospora subsp. antibiotica]